MPCFPGHYDLNLISTMALYFGACTGEVSDDRLHLVVPGKVQHDSIANAIFKQSFICMEHALFKQNFNSPLVLPFAVDLARRQSDGATRVRYCNGIL